MLSRCSHLPSDVLEIFSGVFKMCSGYLNLIYSHIFQDVSGVHRCSWMFSTCSLDILWLSSRFSHDIFQRILCWVCLVGLMGRLGLGLVGHEDRLQSLRAEEARMRAQMEAVLKSQVQPDFGHWSSSLISRPVGFFVSLVGLRLEGLVRLRFGTLL